MIEGWEVGVRRHLTPAGGTPTIYGPPPDSTTVWARRGKYIRFTSGLGAPKRCRVEGSDATTLALAPLRWYERLRFFPRDVLAWAMRTFS